MQITSHYKVNNCHVIKFYGITQNPETKNYIMILDYAEDGSLRNHLDTSYNVLDWFRKILYLKRKGSKPKPKRTQNPH